MVPCNAVELTEFETVGPEISNFVFAAENSRYDLYEKLQKYPVYRCKEKER